ncbi:pyrroloquinoline quinone-dependent dehydrogenase [Parahaliea aestuarii]|uniref:Pyrroloquinoline quinone-dependent dehydrogenase n=1 Tax=Parahaliea aestuarii TaxID=1852021 RepID=A0A5C9A0I4_9GAMM|nr:pyrroloquinoline quinone-dependent dehydrogenase [Parahaliea aestuarii]TXS93392.1 pyrroloquinoline quinone-dependent dehydrogenase [Parahaliea aestuarii]
MRATSLTRLAALFAILSLLGACSEHTPVDYSGPTGDWPVVGGTVGRGQYSALDQITPDNIDQLEVAWTHHSGDFARAADGSGKVTAFEASPLVVDDTLYYCTPYNRIFALDPETGEERWVYDAQIDSTGVQSHICRGVTYWEDPEAPAGAPCARRIFMSTVDSRMVGVDAGTGRACEDFGSGGAIDLMVGMEDFRQSGVYPTSPPLAIGDVLVTGALVIDNRSSREAPGVVRGFDARSGELRWAFDPVPPSMTPVTAEDVKNGASFTPSTPNAWSLITGDSERGIVYVPMGNPANDFYGGEVRRDLDYYGSSLVALDAASGAVKWHFQTVHHDLWDYDLAAQPVPFTQQTASGPVPGVMVATKTGFIFLLNGETGEPLFPVEERPVAQTDVPGEYSSPTQPFPTKPAPLLPDLSEDDLWGMLSFYDEKACREQFAKLRYEGVFTPPSIEGSLQFPGFVGGVNWGGVSIDPVNNRAVVSFHRFPFMLKMVEREPDQHYAYNMEGAPYAMQPTLFGSPLGAPCIEPPWSYLAAVDLNTGEHLWQTPFGTLENLAPLGQFFPWGGMALGGNLQTAGGLVFIAATMDTRFRAFDLGSGEEVWSTGLPYSGHAMPMTYRLRPDSKQFVVIAAGGKGLFEMMGSKTGDALVAFSLPD